MKEPKLTVYRMITVIVAFGIVAAIIGALISRQYIIFPLSVAAGCLVSVGLLFHMLRCASTIIELPPKRAKSYGRRMSILRILLMIAAIAVAYVYRDYINPWGVLIGLATLKLSAYLHTFVKIDFGHKGENDGNAGSVK